MGLCCCGALYAIGFVFVNAEIAARVRFPASPLWVALLGLCIGVALLDPPTLDGILTAALAAAALTVLAMPMIASRAIHRRPQVTVG